MRQCTNPNCSRKETFGQTDKKHKCVMCGSATRRSFGFSGPNVVSRNTRTKEAVTFRGQIGPCRRHGWACRVFEDCATRR